MSDSFKFNVVAHFSRPIAGLRKSSTLDQGVESVFAPTPESAARRWYWRLSVDQRAVVDRVIVWAAKPHRIYAVYQGETVVFKKRDGKLVETERRPVNTSAPTR